MSKNAWRILQALGFALWAAYASMYLALALYVTDPNEPLIGDLPAIYVVIISAIVGIAGIRLIAWMDTKIDGKDH